MCTVVPLCDHGDLRSLQFLTCNIVLSLSCLCQTQSTDPACSVPVYSGSSVLRLAKEPWNHGYTVVLLLVATLNRGHNL